MGETFMLATPRDGRVSADRAAGSLAGLVAAGDALAAARAALEQAEAGRAAAAAERDLLRRALDASLQGHAIFEPVLDADGMLADLRNSYLNPLGASLLGTTAEAWTGRTVNGDAAEFGNDPLAVALHHVATTGLTWTATVPMETPAGSRRFAVSVVATGPVPAGVMISFTDVEEQTRAAAELHAQARTDLITGLPNRRSWEEALLAQLDATPRSGGRLAVAILDLDHFKLFNDTHGHPAGDRHLAETAAAWTRALAGAPAVLARLGGEEFGLLCPDTGSGRITELVHELLAVVPNGQTASAGITLVSAADDTSTLMTRADAALYVAKRQGRNRCQLLLDG